MNDQFDLGIGFDCDGFVPSSKWQAFKERWFPGWFKKWFPVIKTPVNPRLYEVSAISKALPTHSHQHTDQDIEENRKAFERMPKFWTKKGW
jgi:hypothetical protein